MIKNAKWIWLKRSEYPDVQKSTNIFAENYKEFSCRFAEFEKEYVFESEVKKIVLEISADVKYFLYVNGRYVDVGPVLPGGDYGSSLPMPQRYYNTYELPVEGMHVRVYALVQTLPVVLCDMTQGRNGFICACKIFFADGTIETKYSDETWLCRLHTAALNCNTFDFTRHFDEWKNAEVIPSVWNLFPSEIENLVEEKLCPQGEKSVVVQAGETGISHYELDKIYSGYYLFSVQADGEYQIDIYDYEKDAAARDRRFSVKGNGTASYRSVALTSAGSFDIEIKNLGASELTVNEVSFQFQHYPCFARGDFSCSDKKLNDLYALCGHSLKICRQSIELDSPKHQENMGCAGDYHISSLMNYYSDGDVRLSRFDIKRIANYLEMSDGYMFHTTYGLIWVEMVYAYYMHSGDTEILYYVKPALDKLLKRYAETTDENSLIVAPLNYMFVDWIEVDGYSMHHPPKALGQTVLNAFYYNALKIAATMYAIIDENMLSKDCLDRAEKLIKAFTVFYDEEKGLYFDGLNDEYEEKEWLPKNTDKRYYSWHSNTLAVLYDLAPADKQQGIIEKMLNDESLISPQPYFMHYVLDAIYKVGLFEKYGMKQLDRWKYMTEFGKGLVEGWINCESYGYDYSHVWAGTPMYQLPSKLSGIKILEAGFEKISLRPHLFGLQWAKIRIPTPKGVISIDLQQSREPVVKTPKGIVWILQDEID